MQNSPVQAVYAYQGPELQKDIAELQRGILDAQQVLDTATEHLKHLSLVCSRVLNATTSADAGLSSATLLGFRIALICC